MATRLAAAEIPVRPGALVQWSVRNEGDAPHSGRSSTAWLKHASKRKLNDRDRTTRIDKEFEKWFGRRRHPIWPTSPSRCTPQNPAAIRAKYRPLCREKRGPLLRLRPQHLDESLQVRIFRLDRREPLSIAERRGEIALLLLDFGGERQELAVAGMAAERLGKDLERVAGAAG